MLPIFLSIGAEAMRRDKVDGADQILQSNLEDLAMPVIQIVTMGSPASRKDGEHGFVNKADTSTCFGGARFYMKGFHGARDPVAWLTSRMGFKHPNMDVLEISKKSKKRWTKCGGDTDVSLMPPTDIAPQFSLHLAPGYFSSMYATGDSQITRLANLGLVMN